MRRRQPAEWPALRTQGSQPRIRRRQPAEWPALHGVGLRREVEDLRRTGYSSRGLRQRNIPRLLESVLDQEVVEIPLVEDLASDIRIELPKAADFPVLLGHELLVHRGDLDVEIILWQIEIRPELFRDHPGRVPFDGERAWLVLPDDIVEVQKSRKLPLARMGEVDVVRRPCE